MRFSPNTSDTLGVPAAAYSYKIIDIDTQKSMTHEKKHDTLFLITTLHTKTKQKSN